MIHEVQALVIGAGPSGLAVAFALQGNTLVLEKESRVGGLCRSLSHGGGTFDIGGHSFHTPYPEVRDLVRRLMGEDFYYQTRDARVHTEGILIPYPFQKHFRRHPDQAIVRRCADGLRDAVLHPDPAPRNLEEYIVGRFGRGIADHFLLPYNRKLWARDLSSIAPEWTKQRLVAPGEREPFETSGGDRTPLQDDTVVAYPPRGGFEEFYRCFVPHIPAVELERRVVHLDTEKRIATTADGRRYGWAFLISTIPLPVLIPMIEGVPSDIRVLAEQLEHLSLRVELLLAGKTLETPIQRIYVHDREVPPHKIALNHNSSDALRERPCHAIMAEVSYGPDKTVDVEAIAPKVIDFLCQIDVLDDPDDITWTGHIDVPFAYPVPTRESLTAVPALKEWLARRHIYSLGRFGEWKYDNSDACVASGLAIAPELRARYPA